MNELEKITFTIGLNKETAQWVSFQHQRMERGARLLLDIALAVGEVLSKVSGNVPAGTFPEWLENEAACPKRTAYRYISLFNHKECLSGAASLAEACKRVETLEVRQRQIETEQARERVAEYRRTGIKPEGWRQHTDDKLAREEALRRERLEQVKQEALEQRADGERERLAWDERRAEGRRLAGEAGDETAKTAALLDRPAAAALEREAFKASVRLSPEGMQDPFQDAVLDYLETLENDSRRIEACYNIIKLCKRIAVDLQAGAKEAASAQGSGQGLVISD